MTTYEGYMTTMDSLNNIISLTFTFVVLSDAILLPMKKEYCNDKQKRLNERCNLFDSKKTM